MSLKKYYEEKVRIRTPDGKIFEGKVTDYFYPEDNEPERESIAVKITSTGELFEFPEEDILSIEIIE